MNVKLVIKITGWLLIIILGIIHFYNREDLSVLYSGFKGFMFNASFLIAIGLIFFINPHRKREKSKAGILLACIGLVLLISGIILTEALGRGVISLSLVFIGVMTVMLSDFLTESFDSEV